MDRQIQKTVKVYLKVAFQTGDVNQQRGDVGGSVGEKDVGSIAVGDIFHVISPSLHKTAIEKSASHRIFGPGIFIQLAVYGLV